MVIFVALAFLILGLLNGFYVAVKVHDSAFAPHEHTER